MFFISAKELGIYISALSIDCLVKRTSFLRFCFLYSIWCSVLSWREVFKKVIVEFFERGVPSLVERELVVKPFDLVCIIGPRRAGKTYYFYQVIRELMDSGCRCLYVDFEYEFLRGVKAVDLVELFNAYRELYGVDPEYVFLDEIHVVSGWEYFVRRIRGSGLYRVYITGSSSKLLAREVATQLRGRAVSYILLPFSFREYLKAIGFSNEDI